MRISFERLVVAAGGLENVALLRRSLLPVDTPRTFGHHYQDHTACEVLAYLPAPFRRFHLGAEGGIELPELSGDFAGLGVRTLMLPVELTHEQLALLADGGKYPDAREVECLARFYLQIEVPPEWGLALRSRGWQSYLHTMPYLAHLPQMDAASLLVVRRMESAGIRIARVQPHYRSGFGGHHFAGTTPMSRTAAAVVGPDSRLIGTENVYLNGASVLPRCGYSGPTLTIVALGLRLGARLAGRPTDKPAPAA